VETGFAKKDMLNKKTVQDDDSKKRHPALYRRGDERQQNPAKPHAA
jgi:hypothetical protein